MLTSQLSWSKPKQHHTRDCNLNPVFSISGLGNLIPGFRRDSGTRDFSVLNPRITKTGMGLQALDYIDRGIRHYITQKINYCNAINRI